MTASLQLDLLGTFRASDSDGRELPIRSRKARALLAFLTLHPGVRIERERLALLLWEDSEPESARTSLRQALASLRRALPENLRPALTADATTIALQPDHVSCDVLRLRARLLDSRADALIESMELYRGALLDGFEAQSTAYDDWLEQERRALRLEIIGGIERLVRLCVDAQDPRGELAALTRLLAIDPANERAHRALMQLHAQQGDLTAALRQYRVCRDALRRELDVAPDPATEALHREIMKRRRSDHTAMADQTPQADDGPAAEVATPAPLAVTMREGVVVAIRLPAMTSSAPNLDLEESRSLMTKAAEAVRDIVERHGGICDRPQGERMLAVFGIENTHGNEPAHAASAALEIVDELSGMHETLRPAVGMASGQLLPDSAASVFPLAGPAVGCAIELAQSAGSQAILLSEPCQRALADRHDFTVTCSTTGTGNRMSHSWRLDRRSGAERTTTATPFAGRHAELALVSTLIGRAIETGRGRTLLVRGEPGIGKTRLIEVIRRLARERGLADHVAVVLDCGQAQAQRPLAVLAASLLDIARPASGRPLTFEALETAAKGIVEREDLIFLADVTVATVPDDLAALADNIDLDTRQHGRARVLARLVEHACTHKPQLLVIEDVHWARPVESARLADLAASIVNLPAILLMSTRPDDDPCTAPWRARARGCPLTTFDLAPLGDDEARELAAHYAGVDSKLIEDCLQRASGHPLFLDQLLRAATAGEHALPGSVRALALAKIDRLPPSARRTLQAAAVLGLECSRSTLEHLLAGDRSDPEVLAGAGLLIEGAADTMAFAHALFRDAVYESMLTTTRLDLHRRAAEIYGADDPPLRAWHLEQARDPRAAEACLLASRFEQEAHRVERALAFAQSARRLATEPVVLSEALQRVGEIEVLAGRTHDAIAAYHEAIDVAPTRSARAHAWFGLASALRVVDRYDEALDGLERAEAALEGTEDPALRTRICSLRGNLHFPRGDLDACLDAHRKAHHYAQLADSPVEVARALGGLGDAWYQRGRMLSAREHYEKCVSICVEHGLTALELAYSPMLALARALCGDITRAVREGDQAAAKARRLSDLRADMLANDVNATVCVYAADFRAALAAAERTLELARRLGARRFEIEAAGVRGIALVGLKQREEGRHLIEAAAANACEQAPTYCAPWLLGGLAAALEDTARRRVELERGEGLLTPGSVSHNHFEFNRYAIDVALEEGWWDKALRYATALERYTRAEPLPWSSLVIERARALTDFGRGDHSDAMRARLESIAATARESGFEVLLPALTKAIEQCTMD